MGSYTSAFTSSSEISKPLFDYRDYNPAPIVAYTCNEEEANDLVSCLSGYVFFSFSSLSKNIISISYSLPHRAIGFDMEWRVVLRRGQPPQEQRTALIQLGDARMIVLVQLSSMESKYRVYDLVTLLILNAFSFRVPSKG